MASAKRNRYVILILALLCLLAVSNLIQIGAKSSENGDGSKLQDLELEDTSGEEDVGAIVDDGQSDVEEEEGEGGEGDDFEDDEEEDEEDEDADPLRKTISEEDVVVLGSGNFTTFVQTNPYVLVEFYAPWCGHCQELTPEWAAAATSLKGAVPVAKVDATAHEDIAGKYQVTGYPTIFFFIDGEHKPYTGSRTTADIVKWVKRKIGPSVTILSALHDAEPLLELESPTLVAYLESVEGAEAEELISAARQDEAVIFYMTSKSDVAHIFGLDKETKPAVVLLKKVHETRVLFDGTFERKALQDFVSTNKLPLVITFNRETAPAVFENDIKKQVLLFVRDEEYEKVYPIYEEAARSFTGQLLFIHVNLSNPESNQILQFFGITGAETSVMGFVAEEDGRKFLYEDVITINGLKAFGKAFVANKLRPYLKSEPIPEKNDEDVKIAVGKNFEEIVLDETKDTLLEIYAPWCGHCQSLEPIYKKLAKRLRGIDSLSIVKMDGTLNDHPLAKPDGFPTILFFPAGKKSFEPITFEGDRTVKGFYQFLKKNAAIPFSLPKTTTPKASKVAPEIVQDSIADLKDEL